MMMMLLFLETADASWMSHNSSYSIRLCVVLYNPILYIILYLLLAKYTWQKTLSILYVPYPSSRSRAADESKIARSRKQARPHENDGSRWLARFNQCGRRKDVLCLRVFVIFETVFFAGVRCFCQTHFVLNFTIADECDRDNRYHCLVSCSSLACSSSLDSISTIMCRQALICSFYFAQRWGSSR